MFYCYIVTIIDIAFVYNVSKWRCAPANGERKGKIKGKNANTKIAKAKEEKRTGKMKE